MEKVSSIKKIAFIIIALAVAASTVAFQSQPSRSKSPSTDTLPDRNKKIRDIDDAMDELEKSSAEVEQSIKDIDFGKIEKEIREATKNIHLDAAKMKADIDKALKEIDTEKIQRDIQASLSKIDAAKIQAEVEKAVKAVDFEKIQVDVQASIAKIDWDKINQQLEVVKSMDFEKIEADIKKIKPDIEKSMKDARQSIEKAKVELKAYKNFIEELDRDGLINKKETYKIEYRNGELIVNGKKQPAEVANKYKNFLNGRKDFTIKKEDDGFNIENE